MAGSLLNRERPPVFCPGCSHERITHALDGALQRMGLRGNQVAIVTDIGCSGLFDTYFHTHAFHGLHGRALTYAAGLKLARPGLTVVATMGDGGLGIGGAHLLAACRRNLNITLLVLNNFNFGMTGGQFSATTPPGAEVASGFLNRLENPLDVCRVAMAGGAGHVTRCSAYRKDLPAVIEKAIRFQGFSLVDLWGICPGRYTRRNKLTPSMIQKALEKLPSREGPVRENLREEYGHQYREMAAKQGPVERPPRVEPCFESPTKQRQNIVILGSAGQRIVTAGEILCLAGLGAGMYATQKNEYNITVLRGPSITEVILSSERIGFTGIQRPSVVLALSEEGVQRRSWLFPRLDRRTVVIQAFKVEVPDHAGRVYRLDFKGQGIKPKDWALAGLSIMAKLGVAVTPEMLEYALHLRFRDRVLESALDLVRRVEIVP